MVVAYSKLKEVTLYRGLTQKFDPNQDGSDTDAPTHYSYWTDSPQLARQYAGPEGFVYCLVLPQSEMGDSYIDSDGERPLFFPTGTRSLNHVMGTEYLVYHGHEKYSPTRIKLYEGSI